MTKPIPDQEDLKNAIAAQTYETPRLITTRSDAEIAAEIRARLASALAPVADIINEAREHGLVIANLGGVATPSGRHVFRADDIIIVKHL